MASPGQGPLSMPAPWSLWLHECSVLKLWFRCLLFSLLSQMYHHFTCATDTGNVSTVFNACKEIILQDNLKGSGFMD